MSEATAETAARDPSSAAASTAVAVRPTREVRVVEAIAPLFDTAKFEHYGRIAAVMATASLVPKEIRGSSREEAVGNCFMIVSLADRLGGFDPWAVAQDVSVIHDKLMLGGKLVAAAIRQKLGIEFFTHYTGTKGNDDFRVYICDEPFTDAMIANLEPGKGLKGYRVIDGSVGEWKTFEKDGRTVKGNWLKQPDIQLFYRGGRVWTRRFESGIMLGLYTEDEMDDLEQRAAPRAKRNLAAALENGAAAANGAGAGDTGFDRQHVADETGEERKDAKVDGAEAEAIECDHEFETIEDGERVCKHCGVLDETPENSEEAQQRTVTKEETHPDLEADAAFLADLSGEETEVVLSRLRASDKAGDKLDENPQAEAGETYLLAGDEFTGKDKRRVTYKDGVAFSSVGPQGAAKLKVYAIHAEAPEEEERPTSQEADTGTGGAPSAEAEQASPASATPASGASQDREASSPAQSDDPVAAMVAAKFGAMKTWPEIKQAWADMAKTTDFVGASPDDQNAIRRAMWPMLAKLGVDQSQDITAFSVWLPTQKGRDGADAIKGTFDVLKRSDVWAKLTDAQVETLEKRVAATISSIGGV